jgi:phage terminase small subunit
MQIRPGAKVQPHGNSGRGVRQRRARFIDAYIANGQNARQAAISIGVPENRADDFAKNVMRRPDASAEIDRRLAELAAPHKMNAERAMNLLVKVATNDRRKFFNADGTLKMVHELDEDTQLALDGFDVESRKEFGENRKVDAEITTSKVKLAKRLSAIDMLFKHFGLYAKDNAQRTADPDEVAAQVRAKLAEIDNTTGGKKR